MLQVVGCALAWRAAHGSILPHLVPGDSATVRRAVLAPSGGALRPLLDLGGLLPLGLAALWLQAHFDRIPARYVIHWGPSGPDGWGTNTPRQVYAPLLLGAALVLLFAGLHWLIRTLTPVPLARRQAVRYILNHMVQYSKTRLDASFAALSDATRRGVLEQLGRADASITDLAEKFQMTLTGMKKHVGVLEQAGLVATEKVGRVRTCKLGPRRLEDETAWLERYRRLWDARFDALDRVVEELNRKEKIDGRTKRE